MSILWVRCNNNRHAHTLLISESKEISIQLIVNYFEGFVGELQYLLLNIFTIGLHVEWKSWTKDGIELSKIRVEMKQW